jgi:hypothetical protein
MPSSDRKRKLTSAIHGAIFFFCVRTLPSGPRFEAGVVYYHLTTTQAGWYFIYKIYICIIL